MPGNRALYQSSYNLMDMDGHYWWHAFHKKNKQTEEVAFPGSSVGMTSKLL